MAKRPHVPTLPPKEALILELLVQENEMYGLQLVAASRRRTEIRVLLPTWRLVPVSKVRAFVRRAPPKRTLHPFLHCPNEPA